MLRRKNIINPSASGANLLREELNSNSNTSGFLNDSGILPKNKGQLMENFEEWIKLATDNKINSKNSWNFALIDYFHDLNVIKDGENINFQKASATLDGCVKIYSSRVDSVATETGKLLSGLATKRSGSKVDESDEENDLDPNGDLALQKDESQKRKKKRNQTSDSTLVEFSVLKIKKLEQELAIDPLFKKALAEFDEGGAKSLLLNTLDIDHNGRVIFDATTKQIKIDDETINLGDEHSNDNEPDINIKDEVTEDNLEDHVNKKAVDKDEGKNPVIDLSDLKRFIYNHEVDLSESTICPSLKQLELVLHDIHKAKDVLQDVNHNRSFDRLDEEGNIPISEPDNFDYDLGFDFGGNDDDEDEEGMGTLDNEAADIIFNETMGKSVVNDDPEDSGSNVAPGIVDKDLMSYFDQRMKKNWQGPEHWRVQALRNKGSVTQENLVASSDQSKSRNKKVKEKLDFSINFMEEEEADDEEILFKAPKGLDTLCLKKSALESETKHLLPEDYQFSSERLTNFFLKTQKSISIFTKKGSITNERADEFFFAEKYIKNSEEPEAVNDFFDQPQDEFDQGCDFSDSVHDKIIEETPDTADEVKSGYGTQLITGGRRMRPEYVNFSRTAKKVDVKILKDNLWKTIRRKGKDEIAEDDLTSEKEFGLVVKNIGKLYSSEEKKDLSTSFCFICLLHLANEHGLSIESNENLDDLRITGF